LPPFSVFQLVARSGVTLPSGVTQVSMSKTLMMIGWTSRAPVVAGFSVSGGSAQLMVSSLPPPPPPPPDEPEEEQAVASTLMAALRVRPATRARLERVRGITVGPFLGERPR
jgi:hypothetical protein